MLFRKNMESDCRYCTHCTHADEDYMQCAVKGRIQPEDNCRKFEYDPCKRIPSKPKAVDFTKYEEFDYSL